LTSIGRVRQVWTSYRYAGGTDPRDHDAATLVALVDGFRSVLQRHLTNEVSMLLKLEKDYDSGALLKMWRIAEKATEWNLIS